MRSIKLVNSGNWDEIYKLQQNEMFRIRGGDDPPPPPEPPPPNGDGEEDP